MQAFVLARSDAPDGSIPGSRCGLTITGANVRWTSGKIVAPLGSDGEGGDGYGTMVRHARNVRIEAVTFGASRKAVVLDRSEGVTIAGSRFDGYGEDGVIVSQVTGLLITRNRFVDVRGKRTSCTEASGVVPGLAQRDCVTLGGTWADGWHPDAVQMRNGVKRAVITFNYVAGQTQGLTQMDTVGDAPLEDVLIVDNEVRATAHHVTRGNGVGCINCRRERNAVRRFETTTLKAVVRALSARRYGTTCRTRSRMGLLKEWLNERSARRPITGCPEPIVQICEQPTPA